MKLVIIQDSKTKKIVEILKEEDVMKKIMKYMIK